MQKYKAHTLATGDSTFKESENTILLQELSAYLPGSHIVYGAGTPWEELAVIDSTKACWRFSRRKSSVHTHKTVRPCVLKRHYDQTALWRRKRIRVTRTLRSARLPST